MSLINVNDLTFAYDGSYDHVFENVSFQIDTNWKLGLIGRNGRGKTTLLRLLNGELEYRGSIAGGVNFAYFPYPVSDPGLPASIIARQICPDFQDWQLEKELNLLAVGLDVLDRPFDTLSGGEKTKILLALLFLRENSFLLIDEPTNHLDQAGRAITSRYLKSKQGFIVVSHDRYFLDDCVDHIMAINRTDIEIQRGNFSSWQENKRRQDEFELNRNEQLKREIGQLRAAVRRSAEQAEQFERSKIGSASASIEKSITKRSYMGEKSRKVMSQSKNYERRQNRAIDEKSALLGNLETAAYLKLSPLTHHARHLVQLDQVTISYGEKIACREVSFTVSRGERVSLQGRNGSGKSSILRLICGASIDYAGKLMLASGLIISYVPQDSSFMQGNLTDYARSCQISESLFKAILNKLDFTREQFDKDMANFSEGQKKKVLIARSLCEKAHLYIWDEPLNYIDVFSRMQIEDLILNSQPTLLVVEHDQAFTDRIATRTIDLTL